MKFKNPTDFRLHREIMSSMVSGNVTFPNYENPACFGTVGTGLPHAMEVYRTPNGGFEITPSDSGGIGYGLGKALRLGFDCLYPRVSSLFRSVIGSLPQPSLFNIRRASAENLPDSTLSTALTFGKKEVDQKRSVKKTQVKQGYQKVQRVATTNPCFEYLPNFDFLTSLSLAFLTNYASSMNHPLKQSTILFPMVTLFSSTYASAQSCPSLVGSYNTPDTALDVAVSGNYAFVADGIIGFLIIDISVPKNPTLTGFCKLSIPNAWDVAIAVSGNYAFVGHDKDNIDFHVIDITNITRPQYITYVNVGSFVSPGGTSISGNYIYLALMDGTFRIIDISTPTSPSIRGSTRPGGTAKSISVLGNYAYMAAGNEGLRIIDISNKNTPGLAGTYDTPGFAYGVAVLGNYAFVADGDLGLQIVDVSNKVSPSGISNHDTLSSARDVAIANNYAYIVDYVGGLQIIDVSNVFNPRLAGYQDVSGLTVRVVVFGNFVYLASGVEGGLHIINIECPPSSSSSIISSSSSWSSSTNPSSIANSSSRSSISSTNQPSVSSLSNSQSSTSSSIIGKSSSMPLVTTIKTNNSSIIWIGFGIGIGSIICLELGGIIAFLVYKKRGEQDQEDMHPYPLESIPAGTVHNPSHSSEAETDSQYGLMQRVTDEDDQYQRTPDRVTPADQYQRTPDRVTAKKE